MSIKQDIISFDKLETAFTAVVGESTYVDSLDRRTDDEAQSIPAFLTLLRRYIRQCEEQWVDNPSVKQSNGDLQVTECLDTMRKITTIAMRAMIYNGIVNRKFF